MTWTRDNARLAEKEAEQTNLLAVVMAGAVVVCSARLSPRYVPSDVRMYVYIADRYMRGYGYGVRGKGRV
jgi:hypothetical protein